MVVARVREAPMRDLFDPPRPTIAIPREPCLCGSMRYAITPGVGPHAAGLRCATCEQFKRWMSKIEYEHWQEISR